MKKRKPIYRLSDLAEMAAQLNCRVSLQLFPAELPSKPDNPALPKKARKDLPR